MSSSFTRLQKYTESHATWKDSGPGDVTYHRTEVDRRRILCATFLDSGLSDWSEQDFIETPLANCEKPIGGMGDWEKRDLN